MSLDPQEPQNEAAAACIELHFSPRELVKSVLRLPAEPPCECGVKSREVRWQQGAIAVCILMVYTRLRDLEGATEPPVLEGGQGSPARSIDNLLNKPGDWVLHMFGEQRGLPRIRDFIYRKKTVSRSNPVSAVQWDVQRIPAHRIRIWQAETELSEPPQVRALLRTLLREFHPKRVDREWARLFPPAPSSDETEAFPEAQEIHAAPGNQGAGSRSRRISAGQRDRMTQLLMAVFLLVLGLFVGRMWPEREQGDPAAESAEVVDTFIRLLNAGNLDAAYDLTSARYRESVPPEAFDIAYGDQRYNFPRLAGNPYRNTTDSNTHDFRVTLYVETRVRRIPNLGGLSRIPLTRIEDYASRLAALTQTLSVAGIDEGLLNQLSKERLERRDASRHIQLVCGLNDQQIAAIFPEEIATTLDLTLFFELVRDPSGTWTIHSIQDATERLVAF